MINSVILRATIPAVALLALQLPPGAALVPCVQAAMLHLGDLNRFQMLAVQAETMLDQGHLADAGSRMRQLANDWHAAEPRLKPGAIVAWYLVDNAINNALTNLQATRPNPIACKRAMTDLLDVMNRVGK